MASYLSENNIALYTIPAAYAVALAPRLYTGLTYKAATKKSLDTKQPRDYNSMFSNDQALDSKTKGRLLRAEAAQANGFETLPLFAAAVVAGTFGGVNPMMVNSLSIGYVVSRFAYNHIYIFNDIVPVPVRTATYFVGIGTIFALFIQAGNNLTRTVL